MGQREVISVKAVLGSGNCMGLGRIRRFVIRRQMIKQQALVKHFFFLVHGLKWIKSLVSPRFF